MHEAGTHLLRIDFIPPAEARLRAVLDRFTRARILLIGDLCLDVYWFVDPSRSEESLETGLPTHPVREQHYSPGGAGNVACNLVAAGCREIRTLGVIGEDPWGRELMQLLRTLGVLVDEVLVQRESWATPAYTKPCFDSREASRFDFGEFNELSTETACNLLSQCRKRIPEADVVIVNQQIRHGIHTKNFRSGLAALIKEFPDSIFIVDSRHCSDSFAGVHMKINDHEAVRLCGTLRGPGESVSREEALAAAGRLYAGSGKPVFVTRGIHGMTVADHRGLWELPGVPTQGLVDPVGGGDSALAGISLALAAGCDAVEAGHIGNLLAGVTIQKLNQTGTATPEEIIAVSRWPSDG
jgi:rfaE bifunctional protein kinase chain/domain